MEPIAEYDEDTKPKKHMWWYGATGTGKTRLSHDQYPGAYYICQDYMWKYYQEEPVAILDNVDKQMARKLRHQINRWGDDYEFPAEMRKPTDPRMIRPELIIIISNMAPEEIYGEGTQELAKIRRRFSVVEFKYPLHLYEK